MFSMILMVYSTRGTQSPSTQVPVSDSPAMGSIHSGLVRRFLMEYIHDRRRTPPWVWVLVTLGAVILVFVIWWAVAASGPRETVVVTPEERQPSVEPTPQQPPPSEQPVVVEPSQPVNIFIERNRPTAVIIVPRGQEPPEARENLEEVALPGEFRYRNRIWQATTEVVMGDQANLRDIGATVDGNPIYADQDARPPYDVLHLETEKGSGIFIKYKPVRTA